MTMGLFTVTVISAAIAGALAGLIGGLVGAALDSTFFSTFARISYFSLRAKVSRIWVVVPIGIRGGAMVGFIVGAITGAIGGFVLAPVLLLGAVVVAGIGARKLRRAAGESIAGLYGAMMGAAFAGVIGGYLGRMVGAGIWNRF